MTAPCTLVVVALSLLLVPSGARGYLADLVPAPQRIEAEDIEGSISIAGAEGTVRVRIEGLDDVPGVTVQLRVRVNGVRRRVAIAVALEDGDGEASASLGLQPDDRIIVQDIRVRGPDHRTLAHAGVVTAAVAPPPPAPPPPPPSECPAALALCQDDLEDCAEDLAECELE